MMTIQAMANNGDSREHNRQLDLDEQRLLAYKKDGSLGSESVASSPGRTLPPDHLPMDRSAVDEHDLVRSELNSDIVNEEGR